MLNKNLIICLLLLMFAGFYLPVSAKVVPTYLRTEYKQTPYTDVSAPRLSWELSSKQSEEFQTAYQIIVSSSSALLDKNQGDLWDSGKISSDSTNQIVYKGKPIPSKTRVYWKVRSWNKANKSGKWSDVSWWETGLMGEKWQASWIGFDLNQYGKGPVYHLPPAPYFRKEHQIEKKVQAARLYITALGVYDFFINGYKIGDDYFAPGWTDYNKRVYYNVYDVSDKLQSGENVLASTLSYGWYAGYLGYALAAKSPKPRGIYGEVPLLKAQLEIAYTDGSTERIVTDNSWKTDQGPLRETDFLQGETYDARMLQSGWNKPGFDDTVWQSVQVYPDNSGRSIQLYPADPVKVFAELQPQKIIPREDGKYIVDFGQNFAGMARLNVKGERGDTVRLRFGEMLHPDGSLMTENLRKARAIDTYVLSGDPQGEIWQPQFTYHGFQFVEVSGLRQEPGVETLTGIALRSATPETGQLQTDNAMINQLYSNIVWTQWANHIDIPTDCPQRDERLAWTGDAQIYIHSATFNNDIAAFHTKWLVDLHDAQLSNGAYPIYAPMPRLPNGDPVMRAAHSSSPGWSEAGIICVYELYRTYGDTRVIEQSVPYMNRFMEYLRQKAGDDRLFKEGSFAHLSPKGGYSDWLSVGKRTAPDLLATLYYAYCAQLMSEMALAINDEALAERFTREYETVQQALLAHYTDKDGKFTTDALVYGDGKGYVDGHLGFDGHTQTAYANAIYMQLLDNRHTQKAGKWLQELIVGNDGKLSTGFLGFRPLLPALSATGHSEQAYRLLLSTEYPSLGYEVVNGATSIWERWDSYTKEKGFVHNAAMNSFSHYAFGAVNEWMFGNMAGIKTDGPGYRNIVIKPEIAKEGINKVEARYRSINGWIVSSWQKEGNIVKQHISIPVNTKAKVYIPTNDKNKVLINGKTLESSKWANSAVVDGKYVVINLLSGEYKLSSK